MFDYLYEWIRNLAFYLVLVTAVIHVIPNSDYKKYIRFFTGMVLILLLVMPVLKLFGMDWEISNLYNNAEYQEEIRKIENATEYLYGVDSESYLKEAEENDIQVEEIRIGHEKNGENTQRFQD